MRGFGGILFFVLFSLVSLTTQRSPANGFPGCISSTARSMHQLQAFEDVVTRRILIANADPSRTSRLMPSAFVDRRFEGPMKKDLVMSSDNAGSASLSAQELIAGAPYRNLQTGQLYKATGKEQIYGSYEMGAAARSEMLASSPSALMQKITALRTQNHLVDATMRFPAESFKFFVALGAVGYLNATQHPSRNPMAFQQLADQQTDPVGHLGFLAFIYANSRCGAALQPLLFNSRLRFFTGYLGMTCGMTASNIVHEVGVFAPEVLTLLRQSFANPGSRGEQKRIQALDEAHSKWTELSLSKKMSQWMPGLGSLLAASFAAGMIENVVCAAMGTAAGGMARFAPKAVAQKIFGIDLMFKFAAAAIPVNVGGKVQLGSKIVFGAFKWAVQDIPKFALFLYASEILTEPFTVAYESWLGTGPNLQQSEKSIAHLLKEKASAGSFSPLRDSYYNWDGGDRTERVAKCKDLDEATGTTKCYNDLDLEILRYSELNRTYREVLIGDLLMAQGQWASKLAQLSDQYRVSSNVFKKLLEFLKLLRKERGQELIPGTLAEKPITELLTEPEPLFGINASPEMMEDPLRNLSEYQAYRTNFRRAQIKNVRSLGKEVSLWLNSGSSTLIPLLERSLGTSGDMRKDAEEYRGSQLTSSQLKPEERESLKQFAFKLINGNEAEIGESMDWLNLALSSCARDWGCDRSQGGSLAHFQVNFQGLKTRYLKHQNNIPKILRPSFLSILKLLRFNLGNPEPLWESGEAYFRLMEALVLQNGTGFGTPLEEVVFSGPRKPSLVDNAIAGFYYGPSPLRDSHLIIQASSPDLLGREAPSLMDPLRLIGFGFPVRLLTPRLVEPDPLYMRVRSGALRPQSAVRGFEPIENFLELTPTRLEASVFDLEARKDLSTSEAQFDLFQRLLHKMDKEIEKNLLLSSPQKKGLLGIRDESSKVDSYWDLHMNSRFLDAWILFEHSYMEVITELSRAYWNGREYKLSLNRPSLVQLLEKEMATYKEILQGIIQAQLLKIPEIKRNGLPTQALTDAKSLEEFFLGFEKKTQLKNTRLFLEIRGWALNLMKYTGQIQTLFREVNQFFAQISYEEKKVLADEKHRKRFVSVTRIPVDQFAEKMGEIQTSLENAQKDMFQNGDPDKQELHSFLNPFEAKVLVNALQGFSSLSKEVSNYAQVVNQVSYVARYGSSESSLSIPSPCIETIQQNFQAFGLSPAQKKKLCGN